MKMKLTLFTGALVTTLLAGSDFANAGFVPINGTYNGLFYESSGYWQQSSGTLTVTTTSRGSYSARLRVGPSSYSFSGRFAPDGSVSRDILRRFDTPLSVSFQVDTNDSDLITGTINDTTNWTADLYADRVVFNKNRQSYDAGPYTMVLLGDATSTNTPGGESYGIVNVSKMGRVTLTASLADGTKLTQSTTVSKDGYWPLYSPLYRGWGSLYSWLQFNASTNEDLSGDVTWIRPEMSWTWYYPSGFAVIQTASGSRYTRPPRGTQILPINNAQIQFNGGNLSQNFTNQIFLDSLNRIQNNGASELRMSFSLSNGSFSGKVRDPNSLEWVPFKGVVLQKFGVAAGYFPGWDETGEVWVEGN